MKRIFSIVAALLFFSSPSIKAQSDAGAIFLLISPIIGILMLVGMISTSVAMICIYIKDFIMEKFYE